MYNIIPELEPLFVRLHVLLGAKNALHWTQRAIGEKPVLIVTVTNFLEGIRHKALIIRDLTETDALGIVASESVIVGAGCGYACRSPP
jgi:hypothetical protein